MPPGGRRSQKGLLVGILAFLVVAALIAGAVLVLGGSDDDSDQVVLEPIDHVQEDDFAGNLDLEDVGADVAIALGDVPAPQNEVEATMAGGVQAGDEPGLYGGSQDDQVCDVQQLIDFMQDEANADKARVWAETLDVPGGVGGIPDYISGLTAVRLRFDTRVTNHGFRDGEANPFPSVLQAGTAVLVDGNGIPRVKCNCGNPLTEPEALGDVRPEDAQDVEDMAQNPEAAWDGFDVVNVVVVQVGDEVDQFVMMDLADGTLFVRPVGSNGDEDGTLDDTEALCGEDSKLAETPTCEEPVLGTGDVQVTLRWDSAADLDLAVVEPNGTRIDFTVDEPTSTGGQLDVDGNADCNGSGTVENVYWPEGQAPTGTYQVEVNAYDLACEGDNSGSYTLTIKITGEDDQVHEGTVTPDDPTHTYDFDA